MNNTGNANTDEEAIKAVLNQYEVTLNNGDFNSWISLWTDNGVQLPPNTPLRIGKEPGCGASTLKLPVLMKCGYSAI